MLTFVLACCVLFHAFGVNDYPESVFTLQKRKKKDQCDPERNILIVFAFPGNDIKVCK